MYPRSFLCEEAKIKQRTPLKKELCEINEEAIWESRFTSFFLYLTCVSLRLLLNRYSSLLTSARVWTHEIEDDEFACTWEGRVRESATCVCYTKVHHWSTKPQMALTHFVLGLLYYLSSCSSYNIEYALTLQFGDVVCLERPWPFFSRNIYCYCVLFKTR